VPRSLNEPGVGRGIKRDRRIGNTDDQRGRRAGAVRPHDRDPGGGLHLRRAALRYGDSAGPSCARAAARLQPWRIGLAGGARFDSGDLLPIAAAKEAGCDRERRADRQKRERQDRAKDDRAKNPRRR